MLDRLYGAVRGIDVPEASRAAAEPLPAVVEALEDDRNTPKGMAEFFGLARELNKEADPARQHQLAAIMYATGELLGVLQQDPEEGFAGAADSELTAEAINEMIGRRNAARAAKDFATADALRDELAAAGIQIEDGPEGTTFRRA
jgi:cysteinyl-tRNA synthetase